ncbi:MAG TPA: acylphosphatase [Terriglobia bacterium]|nr:acylphosphatase [Terriglobia bacterium]
MSKRIAKKYRIAGRVQGVGYRFFAEREAHRLGLTGYVKNCGDGSVEAYAVGDEASLHQFKHSLAEGPRSARVTSIDESDEGVDKRYSRFVIEGGW